MALFTGIGGVKKEIKELYTSKDGTKTEIPEMYSSKYGTKKLIFKRSQVKYMAVGNEGTIITSKDGINWEQQNSGVINDLTCVKKCGEQWVVGGKEMTLLISDDGINFTNISSVIEWWGKSYHHLSSIAFEGTKGFLFGVNRDATAGSGTAISLVKTADTVLSINSIFSGESPGITTTTRIAHISHVGYDEINGRFRLGWRAGSAFTYEASAANLDNSWRTIRSPLSSGERRTITVTNWDTGTTSTLKMAPAYEKFYLNYGYDFSNDYFGGSIKNENYTGKGVVPYYYAGVSNLQQSTSTQLGNHVGYHPSLENKSINTLMFNNNGFFYIVDKTLFRNTSVTSASTSQNTFGNAPRKMIEDDAMTIFVGVSGSIYTAAAPLSNISTFTSRVSGVAVTLNDIGFSSD